MAMYDKLIQYYDLNCYRAKIAPIAHTKVSAKLAILLDSSRFKMAAEIDERVIIPCTITSESRTSNCAPHVIHDNLSYVGNLSGYEDRHAAYMEQLSDFATATGDMVARAVFDYLQNRDIMADAKPVLDKIKSPLKQITVVFAVYPLQSTVNQNWTDYYVNSLPKDGICCLTGLADHIPVAYPSSIRYPGDMAKLFIATPVSKIDDKFADGVRPGYIASQKVLHTLQVLCQGNEGEIASEERPKAVSNFSF